MKKWQEKNNYRRIRDDNGVVVENLIMTDGHSESVSEEFYQSYSQMNRQMVYLDKKEQKMAPVSLDSFAMRDISVDFYVIQYAPSAEEVVLEKERMAEQRLLLSKLLHAITKLNKKEQRLIISIYMKGMSARKYAKKCGVSEAAIRKSRDRALSKLKYILENSVF